MSAPGQPVAGASEHAAAPELAAAPEHPATPGASTEEPGALTESSPERSHGASADRGSSPPELVMTHINGSAINGAAQ